MKRILAAFTLLGLCLNGYSQSLRNEWIDYSKTYYKFKVAVTGLYRISQPRLAALGLGNANAQDFKLWRNGTEVPLFTSVATGQLNPADYIEFRGLKNDGKPDIELYPDPNYQCSDKTSLFTDTASYFLTISTGTNARWANMAKDSSAHGTAESYCLYDLNYAYNGAGAQIWGGTASYIQGEYVRSSTFDRGEGFQSQKFSNLNIPLGPLKAYVGGPAMSFRATGAGAFIGYRSDSLKMNDSLLAVAGISQFDNYTFNVNNIPLSRITGDMINLRFRTSDNVSQYGLVMLAEYNLTYPRLYDFAGASEASFRVPANGAGSWLVISNFSAGNADPILYDVTNNRRYTCYRDGALVKVNLLPSSQVRTCILVSADASAVQAPDLFTTRNFVNYNSLSNQGNYLLIANRLLNSGADNQVEAYRSFRASAAGGGYNAKVYDVDEIADQFAFGIRKHPIGIRNFLRFARAGFASAPKFVLLIGHGSNYNEYYFNQASPAAEALNQVPGWGDPASDNLLSAAVPGTPVPATPIGRIPVVSGAELKAYLDKVKAFELQQASPVATQAAKNWPKQIIHIVGSNDPYTGALIQPLMDGYTAQAKDTSLGATVHAYSKFNNLNLSQNTAELAGLINNGVSLLTYFGHSSSTSLDFNLNNPNDYTNTNGKYPVFLVNGCNAGNFFTYDESRVSNNSLTISEKFVFAPERGAIAFIASTSFGVVNALDYITKEWYNAAGKSRFGKSLGEIQQKAADSAWKFYNGDYFTRLTLEETTINGDPAIRFFSSLKPDYSIEPQNISFNPEFVSRANDSFNVKILVYNLGKAVSDSITLKVERQLPGGLVRQLASIRLKGILNVDSVTVRVPIVPNKEGGTNYIIATIDAAGQADEMSEANNTATKAFDLSADEILPVYPYPLSIVAKPVFKLYGSTADPLQASRGYRMQLDTSELFNSPLRSQDVVSAGGLVEFDPGISLNNGTVYYWRLAPLINGVPANYRDASFLYNPSGTTGWNQSHLYQHFKSGYDRLTLDSASRSLRFQNRTNNLYIVHSKYPESGTEDSHFSISINGNQRIASACTGASVIFNVFDTTAFNPWRNYPGGLYGSGMNVCGDKREFNFEFPYTSTTDRKKMMDFMNLIPNGYYVTARLILDPTYDPNLGYNYLQSMANTWKADTSVFGSGQSLYHYLYNQGATNLDSINDPSGRIWVFVYRKNAGNVFAPRFDFSPNVYERIIESIDCPTSDTAGTISSPLFGPARQWTALHWGGHAVEQGQSPDSVRLSVVGISPSGGETVLYTLGKSQPDLDISSVNPADYPSIKLKLFNQDAVNGTPWQLDYWRLNYLPIAEGALAPNLYYVGGDSATFNPVSQSTSYQFGVAFKNVSDGAFDSLRLKLRLTDAAGKAKLIPLPKTKPLVTGDTTRLYFELNTDTLSGDYNLFLDVNPDKDQPEQFHFNNAMFRALTVYKPDSAGVCPGTVKTFYAGSSQAGNSYQWQVNTGSGFTNINNDAVYAGAGADTLKLNRPPTSWYGYSYRCVITNAGSSTVSAAYQLKFSVSWTGAISTAWENSSNWGCGILPDQYTDVYIGSGTVRYPFVNANNSCRSLRVMPNSSVTVKAGVQLLIKSN